MRPVKVDDLGNLTVTGAGVTSGTQVQLVDGVDTTLKAKLTAAGALVVDMADTAFNIGNFPAEYALPVAQITDLKVVDVTDRAGRVLGQVTLPAEQITDLKTVTVEEPALEERYEFDANGNPLYVGKAPDGTATTAAAWLVYRFTFVNGLPTRKQVRENVAWDNRATVTW